MAKDHIILKPHYNMHIPLLAAQLGYKDWRRLWELNPDLQNKRKNPLILFHGDRNPAYKHQDDKGNTVDGAAGDKVLRPKPEAKQESGQTKQHHPFKTGSDKVFLRLRVLDDTLEAVKDAKYHLWVGAKRYPAKGEADFEAGGMINVEIPKAAQAGRLVVKLPPPPAQDDGSKGKPGGDQPKEDKKTEKKPPPIEVTFEVAIGRLNPIQEKAPDDKCVSGVQQRLNNLGFGAGVVDGIAGPNTNSAIRRFQSRFQIPVTGKSDAKTQGALHDFHDQPGKAPAPKKNG